MLVPLLSVMIQVSMNSGVDIGSLPQNSHYANQRAPLAPSPLQKLPVGSVRGEGWLKVQLELQKAGFSGHLTEISHFLDIKNNAWMGTGDGDRAGWEELPYWLRGQISLAYVTNDKPIIKQCEAWVEGVLATAKPDGWFGPESNRKTKLGTPDLWPNMLMQDVLQTYFEATGDERVIRLMLGYCDYLSSLDDHNLIDPRHYWHYHRVADQLANLIWLYNQTGEPKILKLATRLHHASSDWSSGIANMHGVNFAQGFREPATYSVFSKSDKDWKASEKDLDDFRTMFGQVPGGMYAADENARKGFTDPRQGTESCAIAEMMFSDELLMLYSGDPHWADEAENVAFNEMPVTMTPDLKALRYLQAGNMAVSDSPSKSPGIENGGPMFLMDPNDHRCCQHNIGMGWPYLTEHLWTGTNGNGLAALIYAPSEVTAKVGKSSTATIKETTDYPFDETITFHIRVSTPTEFPLTLRIPSWCDSPSCRVNGAQVAMTKGSRLKTLQRTWSTGDAVTLRLPMKTKIGTWPQRPGTSSVWHGPLAYSLKIDEAYTTLDRKSGWPAFEIHPTSAWNYGLVPGAKLVFKQSKLKAGVQPFELKQVPVHISAKARRIPEWTLDMYGLVSPIQACPAESSEPIEAITLVPMGAARLRMTVFPSVVADGTGSQWKASKQPRKPIPTTYSYRNWFDSEAALSDGLLPESPNDQSIPRFTWWDHKGTEEWVQYNFAENRTFQKSRVYWFNDEPEGGCRTPKSWKLQVMTGGVWTDVEPIDNYTTAENGWSEVTFRPVGGTQVRLVARLRDGWSAGILEWEIE